MTSGEAMNTSELRAAGASAPVYLRGVHYPAKKEHLIKKAKSNGAPFGVIQVLTRLPEMDYANSIEVLKEINRETGLTT